MLRFGDLTTECQDCGFGYEDDEEEGSVPCFLFPDINVHNQKTKDLLESWWANDGEATPIEAYIQLSRKNPKVGDLELMLVSDDQAFNNKFVGYLAQTLPPEVYSALRSYLSEPEDNFVIADLIKDEDRDSWSVVIPLPNEVTKYIE